MKKTLHTTIACILFAAFVAAMGRMFVNDTNMKHLTPYPMHVDTTELLVAYDITNCRLDLACGQMPDTAQQDVILCAAAAFTGKCLDEFDHMNILGPHISQATLHNGYTEVKDGIPFEQRYALFVWNGIDSEGVMLEKGFYSLPNDELLNQVTQQKGMAFTQHWVIKDKNIFEHQIQPLHRVEHFRSICIKENRILIVANQNEMSYQSYLDCLLAYGVENALYMDMGSGWNHSFYRDADNHLHILHPKGHKYPTNWIVVYK